MFDRPEDYGQHPDGRTPAGPTRDLPDYGWREAMKSRQLWTLVAAAVCLSATDAVGSLYLGFIGTDLGFSLSAIGLAIGIEQYVYIIFILAGGWLSYKMPIKSALSGFAAIQAAGAGLLFLGSSNLPLFLVASALMSIGAGALRAPEIAVVGIYFGRRSFGANTATLLLFTRIAWTVALPAVSAIWDFADNIAPVVIIITIVDAVAAALFLLLGQPRLSPSQRTGAPAVN